MNGPGRIASINVSQGGVPKRPIPRARVGPLGLEGDKQRNLKFHGGPQRALCLYSAEWIAGLVAEGHRVVAGALGENVTVEGLDLGPLGPGARLRLGATVRIEVTSYAAPCRQIAPCFSDGDSGRLDPDESPHRARLYAKVLEAGEVAVGDAVILEEAT